MEKTAPSETITADQIGKIEDLLGADLRKSDLPSDAVQAVIEKQGPELVQKMIEVIQAFIEAAAKMIIRRVRVNRDQPPEAALSATGRNKYLNDRVVAQMPRGTGEETEVFFFKPYPSEYTRPGFMSDDDLEKAYDRRGLKAADPYSLAATNEADPAFADEHPNGTHWKDGDGNWCYAVFNRWYDGRSVRVDRYDDVWNAGWWFAGLRK